MTAKVLLCVFAGHRWALATDSYEAKTVLACRRCGRRQTISPEQTDRPSKAEGADRRVR
jgi:hypothetical protein